ncbi:MAG: hypothetical protein MJE68_16525 [Proteobacteria bacterium]|nr:hypothetical protein [Pseudomonadota bacterium]
MERVDPSLSCTEVEKVLVSSNAQFLDPVHEIPLDDHDPVELLKPSRTTVFSASAMIAVVKQGPGGRGGMLLKS